MIIFNIELIFSSFARHSDEEPAHRLRQINTDLRHVEEALRNDLFFRGLLRP